MPRPARSSRLDLAVLAFCALAGALPARAADLPPLETVPSIDLERYTGVWYEIARLPNRFQRECAGDVTATYAPLGSRALSVVNVCRRFDGLEDRAEGVARVRDDANRAKLEVRFAPLSLAWLPFVWGDYWVIDLAADYTHAMVGEPAREYLWILSRKPVLDNAIVQRLLAKATAAGYDTSRIIRSAQGQ